MSHLNIYLSRERETWLRQHLETLARKDNRSLSYIIEEALVKVIKDLGHHVPHDKRTDHRTRATVAAAQDPTAVRATLADSELPFSDHAK